MTFKTGDRIPIELQSSPVGIKARPPRRPSIIRSAPGITLTWLLPYFFIYQLFLFAWPASALLSLIHAAMVARGKRWRRGLLSLAIGPMLAVPALSFGAGILGYFDSPARSYRCYSAARPGSLDPLTRTFPALSEASGFGYDPIIERPYDRALALMVRAFGIRDDHHGGAYPSKAEAFAALASGVPASCELAVLASGDEAALSESLAPRLGLPRLRARTFSKLAHDFLATQADRLDRDPQMQRPWPIRIAEREGLIIFGDERLVFLVSKSSHELFAYYIIGA